MRETRPLQMGASVVIGCWLALGLLGSYAVAGVMAAWQEATDPVQEWGPVFIALLTGTYFALYAVPGAFVLALFHLLLRPVQRVPMPQGRRPDASTLPATAGVADTGGTPDAPDNGLDREAEGGTEPKAGDAAPGRTGKLPDV